MTFSLVKSRILDRVLKPDILITNYVESNITTSIDRLESFTPI